MRRHCLSLIVALPLALGTALTTGLPSLNAQEPATTVPAAPEVSAEQIQQSTTAIKALGGSVMALAQNDPRLDVTLHLADKEVTDEALVEIAKLPGVVWLNLAGTKITDDGLKHLAGIKTLEKLHLEKTGISDAGLAHLKGLEKLAYLNLYGTKVTDVGIVQLYPMKQLRKVYLWQSQVTPDGVKALQAVLSEASVVGAVELKPVEPPMEEVKKEEEKKE